MASKEIKKVAQKETSKKGRRLKRSVRRTLGAISLAAAIAVAAIPTEGLQAASTTAEEDEWGTLEKNMPDAEDIPVVTSADTIYTTGDGKFQFVYKESGETATKKVAILVGYDKTSSLGSPGRLVIPARVDAYMKLSYSRGSGGYGYCAIGQNGMFLYYKVVTTTTTTVSDNDITEEVITYEPCYYDDRLKWQDYANNNDLYYYPNNEVTGADPKHTDNDDEQWLRNADVYYIGNQYVTAEYEDEAKTKRTGTWTLGGTVDYKNKNNGIFANVGALDILEVESVVIDGESTTLLRGIGDYAFYGCTNLDEINLNNNLTTLGVGAFAECINMYAVNIDSHAGIHYIGDYAFYNCQALRTFTVPNNVIQLGNSVFENCISMTTCNLITYDDDGEAEFVSLKQIGARLFKGCSSLTSITFPRRFAEDVPVSIFEGCKSLRYIELPDNAGKTLTAVANASSDANNPTPYSFDWFKQEVPSTFYLKGDKGSALHQTATANEIAFSFYDEDLEKDVYERTITEGEGANKQSIVYRVDEDDNLVFCGTQDGTPLTVETVTLPENVGPHYITTIGASTFQNNCYLTQITIPASITGIEAEAFKGCHSLKWVIFNNPSSELEIGARAFWTQEVSASCRHSLSDEPELCFVGPISYSSAPFNYAMTPTEMIDNDNQPDTYIKYYSGWPSHLVVQYNSATKKNELIDYPILSGLTDYSTTAYKYLTAEQATAMSTAATKYETFIKSEDYTNSTAQEKIEKLEAFLAGLPTNESDAIKAALYLELPDGIEGFKKDLFVEKEGKEGISGDKTITAASLLGIDDYAFKGHKNLVEINLTDSTVSIGTHAFEDCTKLSKVTLPGTVETLGTRPFAGCSSLSNVTFSVSPYFTCENGIIYELDSEGKKVKIVELLEGSGTLAVTKEMTEGITELYPEAFMNTNIFSADFTNSSFRIVPTEAFAETKNLGMVTLPSSFDGGTIAKYAFRNSAIQILSIPGQYTNMTVESFEGATHFDDHTLQIACEEGSMAADFVEENNLQFAQLDKYYRVRFFYYDDERVAHQLGEDLYVLVGNGVAERDIPTPPEKEGKVFDNYYPLDWVCITDHNVDAYAEYKDKSAETFTVTFYVDEVIYHQVTVTKGGTVTIPLSPTKEGYRFQGWALLGGDGSYLTGTSLSNVQADMNFNARFRLLEDGEYDDGTGDPSGSGSPGTSGSPGASDGSGNGSGNGNGTSGTYYNLTVVNGSGSGSYLEGAQPIIIANDPASGQSFDYWSVSPADVKIASTVLSASIITMPASDVTVTAHYKAGSSTGISGSGSTGSGNNNQRPNGVLESVTSGGTTVVIDKNGLSNTGVVSATVNGSSDNFTIKITETAEANEAALRALMAEYGDNLDNIKYFPMDISLYDSTGTNKITDTSGLSISITLPLPDSLITYAGNNMVASTSGNKLERLSARFSTIQGVSCITFTAEHFSPYVIYVNTGDLSSGLVSDDTPKTGDFIHPKWFLSIGLACLSFVLFMQKDTRKQKRVKVKVKARA